MNFAPETALADFANRVFLARRFRRMAVASIGGAMGRFVVSFVLLVGLLLGLGACAAPQRDVARNAAPEPIPKAPAQFTNEDQKILACLDLQNHIVDLYAGDYMSREGASLSPVERTAFRDGWAGELAKRGTFERFEQACFSGLTPRKYECGMQSQTTDGLVACMKLSAR
jgi:hypothetical protein